MGNANTLPTWVLHVTFRDMYVTSRDDAVNLFLNIMCVRFTDNKLNALFHWFDFDDGRQILKIGLVGDVCRCEMVSFKTALTSDPCIRRVRIVYAGADAVHPGGHGCTTTGRTDGRRCDECGKYVAR